MVSKSMMNSLFQKQLLYDPEPQPFYTFAYGAWQSLESSRHSPSASPDDVPLKSLHLIAWNVDFMAPQPRARMASAINYLKDLITSIPKSSAVVIFLQEMMESEYSDEESPNDLSQLAQAPWIREHFNITNLNSLYWDAPYGQVSLIDRRLAISQVSRLRFVSEYQRDALLVDVRLHSNPGELLRLCNVHLDSSYGTMRPVQWAGLAKHLQQNERVVASIVAGDCNANQPRDQTAPQENGFKDAYLELGGVEGDDSGVTWGLQSLFNRWGTRRMDKHVFWGSVQIKTLERIGIGVEVEDEAAKKVLHKKEYLGFVTDHYGLMGEYQVEAGLQTLNREPMA